MSFKREGTISTLSGKVLKLTDQFTYIGNNISSTEIDVNITHREGIDFYREVVKEIVIL